MFSGQLPGYLFKSTCLLLEGIGEGDVGVDGVHVGALGPLGVLPVEGQAVGRHLQVLLASSARYGKGEGAVGEGRAVRGQAGPVVKIQNLFANLFA